LETYDHLTGLRNRLVLDKEIERIEKKNLQVSVIIFDIDGLGKINQSFGYEAGNQLIIELSKLIQMILPEDSFIAKYGSDEFAAILYNCDYNVAVNHNNKFANVIKSYRFKDHKVFVSTGVSTTCDEKHTINEALVLAERRMHTAKLLSPQSSSSAISVSLTKTLFERSDETSEHADRMIVLSEKLGREYGLLPFEITNLKMLAMLHDIGKIGISDAILLKPGKLTDKEYSVMKNHPIIGYNIANAIPQLKIIAKGILSHHEHYDGTGYPYQFKKDKIPVIARILSVVDAFDAMTNDRVYHKAISKEAAIKELKKCSGTQFDPEIVDIFIEKVI
jgi:diguanylate cyclase (GGDEF)-like protein